MTTPPAKGTTICFVVAPTGQAGGGMGRVKDYILQSGGDRYGRVVFQAIDTRGSGSVVGSIPLTLRGIARIWAAAVRGRLALVHVNLGDRGSAARKGFVVLMARLVGAKVLLHLHAAHLTTDYARAGTLVKFMIRQPFHAATTCVVLGRLWADWLTQTLHVDPAKVAILYNGVPVTRLPRQADAPMRKILFLGNLLERKGISDLLHAVALLPPDVPPWQLTAAGGGDLAHYRALAESLGVGDRVIFAGWVDQTRARALLAQSDILALPSYDEGLPLVILEALGMGTPVLCTPVGAIPEVLTDGMTALFATPGDRDQLSRNLRRLLTDSSLRHSLSANGIALFDQRFTLAAFTAALFEIYRTHCGIDIEPAAAESALAAE